MKSLHISLLAGAAAIAMATVPSDANALAYAYTSVDVRNLVFTGINAFLPPFDFQTGNTTTQTKGGTFLSDSPAGNQSPNLFGKNDPPLTSDRACGGAPCVGMADIGPGPGAAPALGPAAGTFLTSDSVITSSRTNPGVPAGSDVSTFLANTGGGMWRASAEASASGDIAGRAESTQTFFWTLATPPTALHLEFDVDLTLTAQVTPPGGTARAQWTLGIDFDTFSQDPASRTLIVAATGNDTKNEDDLALASNLGGNGILDLAGEINCTFGSSAAGFRHVMCDMILPTTSAQFSLTSNALAQITSVPEPATLGLLGLGLLGLGYTARRRRAA